MVVCATFSGAFVGPRQHLEMFSRAFLMSCWERRQSNAFALHRSYATRRKGNFNRIHYLFSSTKALRAPMHHLKTLAIACNRVISFSSLLGKRFSNLLANIHMQPWGQPTRWPADRFHCSSGWQLQAELRATFRTSSKARCCTQRNDS